MGNSIILASFKADQSNQALVLPLLRQMLSQVCRQIPSGLALTFGLWAGVASAHSPAEIADLPLADSNNQITSEPTERKSVPEEVQAHSAQTPIASAFKEPEYTRFQADTLYSLLVAELAVRRRQFDIALGNYLLEAHRTQDSQVAEQAAMIAQYIGADQAALDAANLWVRLEPENKDGHETLSMELMKAQRFKEASLHLQKAIDLGLTSTFDYISKIAKGFEWENRAALIGSLDRVLKVYPNQAQLFYQKALVLQTDQEYALALEAADQALKVQADPIAATLKARLHSRLNQKERALEVIEEYLKQFPEARTLLVLKARMLIADRDVQGAKDLFIKLVNSYPSEGSLRLSLALTQLELGEFEPARINLQVLVQQNQNLDDAHYYLGRLAEKDEMKELALNHYLLVESGREYLNAQGRIVSLMVQEGRLEDALQHLQGKRETIAEWRPNLYMMEAEILADMNRYQDALQILTVALEAYPLSSAVLYSRAMISQRMGNHEQTEKDLRTIIRNQPEHSAALNALGYILIDRNERLSEAKNLIDKAYGISPNDPAIIDSHGWFYFRSGNYEESLKWLRDAYSRFPDPEVAAHLGEVLWVSGDQTAAVTIWRGALDKTPDSSILLRTLERLTGAPQIPAVE